jgi:hypothetical protein
VPGVSQRRFVERHALRRQLSVLELCFDPGTGGDEKDVQDFKLKT